MGSIGSQSDAARLLALGQGLYYVATGLWPLLHMGSFERVTGAKTDKWLVKTVGLLVTTVGATLLASARRGPTPETALLGASSALSLAGVDLRYGASGRISRMYLLDAAPEIALAIAWALVPSRSSREARVPAFQQELP